MKLKKLLALAALAVSSVANAAYVTIDEAGLDSIFSQAAFGNERIDIRIGAVTTIVRPDLLNINSFAKLNDLFSQHTGPANVVNFYFVDTVDACDVINANIIGCGEFPGNDFVVESVWAADTTIPAGAQYGYGVQLLAHELGHNLGLDHTNVPNMLMNPVINGFGTLSAAEVDIIRDSSLVQQDASGYYILINPVLIAASATTGNDVPEPGSLALVGGGLLLAGALRRRRAGTLAA